MQLMCIGGVGLENLYKLHRQEGVEEFEANTRLKLSFPKKRILITPPVASPVARSPLSKATSAPDHALSLNVAAS